MTDLRIDERLEALVNGWCDRRALSPLRSILAGYPRVSGLTDEWFELYAALRNVRGLGESHLTESERHEVDRLIQDVGRVLRNSGWSVDR